MTNKIVRSVCLFTDQPEVSLQERLDSLANLLSAQGFLVQTQRIVSKNASIADLDRIFKGKDLFIGAGSLSREESRKQIEDFYQSENISFNLEIRDEVTANDVRWFSISSRQNRKKPLISRIPSPMYFLRHFSLRRILKEMDSV